MRLSASLSLALYSSRVSLHQTLLFCACFSAHPIKPYHWPRACQLHAFLLPIKHTDEAATTLPPELLTHAFFFFFLPLFLTHTHTQMLSHTLCLSHFLSLSDIHTHAHILSLPLSHPRTSRNAKYWCSDLTIWRCNMA